MRPSDESTEPAPPSPREGVRKLLALLADPQGQLAYEATAPGAHVPSELICRWFDDVYNPHDTAFRRAFTPDELAVLSQFNALYDRVADQLEPLPSRVAELQVHPAWATVPREARAVLRAIPVAPP